MAKYKYTCPDVIHDHKVARHNSRIALATNLAVIVGLIWYGRYIERSNNPLPSNTHIV